MHHTSQRRDERGVAERRFRSEAKQILLDEPRGDGDRFRISAIEEKQIIAQILLPISAEETNTARRRIGHDDAISHGPAARFGRDFGDHSRQFMAKYGGRNNQPGMISFTAKLMNRPPL